MKRIFILSPAHSGGERAALIYNPEAGFELARRLHRGEAVPLGEVFSFLSGLYFRGKLAYARAFARPPSGQPGAWVITSNRGLVEVDTPVTLAELRTFSDVDIHLRDERYTRPLRRDAGRLGAAIGRRCEVVLLGSISTRKYTDVLLHALEERLRYPVEFVSRGDMSRGALLLRSVRAGVELDYASASGLLRAGLPGGSARRKARKIDPTNNSKLCPQAS